MKGFHLKRWLKQSMAGLAGFLVPMQESVARSGGNLPFNSTMNVLKDAISGPFLLAAAIIMVVITCLMLAFGEWGDGFKKLINIVLWLSIAFAATSFITTMFGGV